jgi:MFS family permease
VSTPTGPEPPTGPTGPSPAGPTRPTDRYGDRPGRRRSTLLATAGVGLLLMVGFAGWVARHQGQQVSWQEIAYRVDGGAAIGLTFQVSRPVGTAVTCTLRALNQRHTEVGRLDLAVPLGPDPTPQLRARIRTVEPPVAAEVKSCVATGS